MKVIGGALICSGAILSIFDLMSGAALFWSWALFLGGGAILAFAKKE